MINDFDDDQKLYFFSSLTRCLLLNDMDLALYYKLARFINICTLEELKYVKDFDYQGKSKINAFISSLYQYGLFEQLEKEGGGADYVLSGFAIALKENSLNFDEDKINLERILSYDQVPPINISEPTTTEYIEKLFSSDEVTIDIDGKGV